MDNRDGNLTSTGPAVGRHPQVPISQILEPGPVGLAFRLGNHTRPRSVTLPCIGAIGVHDDTRRLRRMLAKDRAKICFATVSHHSGRWWLSLNVEAGGRANSARRRDGADQYPSCAGETSRDDAGTDVQAAPVA
jgi:hypothetical protein